MSSNAFGLAQSALALLLAGALLSCNTAAVKKSYMSLDAEGNRKRSVFYTDTESIYCIGELAVGRMDASVQGTFRSTALAAPPNGELEPVSEVLAVKDVSPGSTGSDVKVSFQLLKTADPNGPWPAGQFECDFSIDGQVEATTAFDIRYPPCPLQPPVSGVACGGFFLPRSVCPGAFSPQSCTCTDAGAWACN